MIKIFCVVVTIIISVYGKYNSVQLAPPCPALASCKLPTCRCSSLETPNHLKPEQTPQFVMFTFDDAITLGNFDFYQQAFNDRKNPDGCSIGATFYVSHEYTDYSMVHKLYQQGHEIAMHSITHSISNQYWRNMTKDRLADEFSGGRKMIANFANIPVESMRGMRLPFLQMNGDQSFDMMEAEDILYDSSWPSIRFTGPGIWPYTLDSVSEQDCPIGPCPVDVHKGKWIVPMTAWIDPRGAPCAMVDACGELPSESVDQLVEVMKKNFLRTYNSNKSPFGFFAHAAWFTLNHNHFAAYLKFIDYLQTLNDVFIVTSGGVVDWVRDPKPISEMVKEAKCSTPVPSVCNPNSCHLMKKSSDRWMTVCGPCPKTYPWINNPTGNQIKNDHVYSFNKL